MVRSLLLVGLLAFVACLVLGEAAPSGDCDDYNEILQCIADAGNGVDPCSNLAAQSACIGPCGSYTPIGTLPAVERFRLAIAKSRAEYNLKKYGCLEEPVKPSEEDTDDNNEIPV